MSDRELDIDDWTREVITGPAGFISFEEHEMPIWRELREVEIARWVVRCLGNVHNDGARFVLDCIEMHRQADGEVRA